MSDSRNDFVTEAEERVRETEDGLLDLRDGLGGEQNPDLLNGVFRSMHTLKGLSGLFNLTRISELSHAMETLLDELRLGRKELTDAVIAVLLENVDLLKRLLGEVSEDGEERSSIEEGIKRLQTMEPQFPATPEPETADDLSGIPEEIARVLSEYEEHRLRLVLKSGRGLLAAGADFEIERFEKELKELTDRIGEVGELIATMPRAADVGPGCIAFDLLVAPKKNPEVLRKALAGCEVRELVPQTLSPDPAPKPAVESAPSRGQDASLRSSSSTVRVDIDRLDAILNTVGELVLAKGAVGRINTEFAENFGYTPLSMDLQKVYKTLEKRLSELQNRILEIRMVPVSQIFSRLHRVVRRYTRDRGKEIDLQLFGEETEIDKLLAEEVIDPLMHLIRNAVDHGIEPAEERRRAGKTEQGTVSLRAYPRGNHVVFEVADDGRGIDGAEIAAKARQKGLIETDEPISDDDLLQLIFLPGFSTAAKVSDVSGRGVGMDVVKEKIGSLGGFVELSTDVGTGTTFNVVLPITLAIIKAILVQVGREWMAIPLAAASETLPVGPGDIQHIEAREVMEMRGQMLPILRLSDVFDLPTDENAGIQYVVVNGFGSRRVGFLVDNVLGQQEVVIKTLGRHLEGIRYMAGAAEVGKHRVVLVLDAEDLMEDALNCSNRVTAAPRGS